MTNKNLLFLTFGLMLTPYLQGQIKYIIYVDISSSIVDTTLYDWQASVDMKIKTLPPEQTLIFVSNDLSPIVSSPKNHRNIFKELEMIEPSMPDTQFDLRQIIKELDSYSLNPELKLIVYTTSDAFQNSNLVRKLFNRIRFILLQSTDNVEINYYLPLSDKNNVVNAMRLSDNDNLTLIYF